VSVVDYESLLERTYRAVLRPGDTAVDIGAHDGRHTLPMLDAVAPDGRVLAFEPLPACRGTLRRALAAHAHGRGVEVREEAISDGRGRRSFVVAVDVPGYSGLRRRAYDRPTRLETIEVEVTTLDVVSEALPSLAFLKLDVEGGEYDAIRGGRACLARFRPVVSFEFGENSIGEYGLTCEDMAVLLFDAGYVLADVTGRALPTVEAFSESARRQVVWDYVALPREHAAALGERLFGAV
jgi:FkbM family methyltransferase